MKVLIKKLEGKLRNLYRRLANSRLHRPNVVVKYKVLGTEYGGWPIPLEMGKEPVVLFSFGVGRDVSFDIAMIEYFGSEVYAFDPTPRSVKWIEEQELPSAFKFYPVGVGAMDGEAEFFYPENEEYVSFSSSPPKENMHERTITAPILRLTSLIERFDLPTPNVLKMDIEGFEYSVIPDLLSTTLRPTILLIEFHHGMYCDYSDSSTLQAVNLLFNSTYSIFYVSMTGREYGFILNSYVE